MRRKIAVAVAAALAACGGFAALATSGLTQQKPPPPVRASAGDSLAYQIGTNLPGNNVAVGGTTVCDTATETNPVDGSYMPLPYADRLFLHLGGHSWGNYDAATAQACFDYILSRYGGTQIFVITTPDAVNIYCGDPAVTDLVLTTYGIPHNSVALYTNPDYELRQRLVDFDVFVRSHSAPNLHIVDGDNIEVNPPPDCTHYPDDGREGAVRVLQAGF